ncbi:uncharacterized protein TNCV_1709901 [Trichonephila clavipes]|nr:uncharacterized protein TNCV_1709901 [Trichonephila clavipes]
MWPGGKIKLSTPVLCGKVSLDLTLRTRINRSHGFEKIRFDLVDNDVNREETVVFVKSVLLKLNNLKILHLQSFGDDTILEMLPSCCAKLEELSMIMSCITEKGLISLCQKENNGDETHSLNLKVIDLSGITLKLMMVISVDTLIENCPNLESLTFQFTWFHLSHPNINLKQLNNLYELSIKSIDYNDNSKQAVINILNCSPKLENLAFFGSDFILDECRTKFIKCCENSNLRILKFDTCVVDMLFLETFLLTCSSLKTLVLDDCEDGDRNEFEALCEALRKVSMSLKNKVEIICKWEGRGHSPVYSSVSDMNMDLSYFYESDVVNFTLVNIDVED